MKIIESELNKNVIVSHKIDIGYLHFFESFVVSEINEGRHFCYDSSYDHLSLISDFYGTEQPFGYISNRVNTFSTEAIDLPKLLKSLNNLVLISVVVYTHFDSINIDLEKKFCQVPYKGFDNLIESYNYTNNFIKQVKNNILA